MTQNDFEILTDRLILRAARAEDAKAITQAKQEVWDELQKWMSWAYDGEETLASTLNYIESSNKNGDVPIIGFCRESGQFVIATGLMVRGDGYDTGYWVAKDFLNKGYATEAAEATMRFGFDILDAQYIGIAHFEGNDKSRRVIEKLGFTKTAVNENAYKRCNNGEFLDEHAYEMTQDEWRQRCR